MDGSDDGVTVGVDEGSSDCKAEYEGVAEGDKEGARDGLAESEGLADGDGESQERLKNERGMMFQRTLRGEYWQ